MGIRKPNASGFVTLHPLSCLLFRVLSLNSFTHSTRKVTEEGYNLSYVVAIRSHHGVWLPANQSVRANKWGKFERKFSHQKSETRYIREIVYGKRRTVTYWEITTDPETMPENSTSFILTNLQGNLKKTLGDLYGLRTWVESGFRCL
jgi:SRSO17 transposase